MTVLRVITLCMMIYASTVCTYLLFKAPAFATETQYITVKKDVIRPPQYQTFEVTAYTAGYESTGKRVGDPAYGITASGEPVIEGRTIACPKSLPFGTGVYIPAMENVYYCTDRGSAITDGKLDIFIEDLKSAKEFGRKKLEVMILPCWTNETIDHTPNDHLTTSRM